MAAKFDVSKFHNAPAALSDFEALRAYAFHNFNRKRAR
jgi:hypothetical protein